MFLMFDANTGRPFMPGENLNKPWPGERRPRDKENWRVKEPTVKIVFSVRFVPFVISLDSTNILELLEFCLC